MNKDVCIIVPVHNEQSDVRKTLNKILEAYDLVVCVNDGSTDNSKKEIEKTKAHLLDHTTNFGQGAAIQTGLEYALTMPKVKYFVTFDGDGQHRVEDIEKMLSLIRGEKLDIVLGSRFLGSTVNLPKRKRIVLNGAVYLTNRYSKIHLTDTHNGLRVFNHKVAKQLDITMTGMAHASEIIDKIKTNNWSFSEYPVVVTYKKNPKRKGQPLLNSLNIMFDLVLYRVNKW